MYKYVVDGEWKTTDADPTAQVIFNIYIKKRKISRKPSLYIYVLFLFSTILFVFTIFFAQDVNGITNNVIEIAVKRRTTVLKTAVYSSSDVSESKSGSASDISDHRSEAGGDSSGRKIESLGGIVEGNRDTEGIYEKKDVFYAVDENTLVDIFEAKNKTDDSLSENDHKTVSEIFVGETVKENKAYNKPPEAFLDSGNMNIFIVDLTFYFS